MKKKLYLILPVILVLGIVVWLFLPTKPEAMPTPTNPTPSSSTSGDTSGGPIPIIKEGMTKAEKMLAYTEAGNLKPLDCYGKVIDQYKQPVVGADVEGNILLNEGIDLSKSEMHHATTDRNGCFSFIGIHGVGIGIWPKKEGYIFDPKLFYNLPQEQSKDPANPKIFTMWKIKGAEQLLHAKIHAYIPCDGTATRYDLSTGKPSASGNFIVKLTRNPVDIDRSKPFDWTLTVEISGGGFVEVTPNTYPNEAPADGYQSSVTIEMPATHKTWNDTYKNTYYFKMGVSYGKITIDTTTSYQPPPTFFAADIYLNLSGSQNLEVDPQKVTEAHH